MDFYDDPPVLKNTYTHDPVLKQTLRAMIPPKYLNGIEEHLHQCGELAVTKWLELSKNAEENRPVHTERDSKGGRVDQIKNSDAWHLLEAEAAQHGIVACGYERAQGEFSRVYQAALLYLFHSSSAFVSCPLAMTDGAARAIELYGSPELKAKAFKNLTSRDPKTFWTSGQWMTERAGGSDVSGTSTTAKRFDFADDQKFDWALNGTKWFTSATTSQMAMTLARPDGAEAGSRGLSLFYVELRDKNQKLKNIEVIRLKPKLGTDALPTAELELKNTPAQMVGEAGNGVKKISALFNITRVYNSICATSHMRRALDLAQDFSAKRKAFGKPLNEHILHKDLLDHLENEWSRCFTLTFKVAHLLGKDECGTATEDEKRLLRALTPIAKLYTAKKCMQIVSEVVEIFGGAGYVEDTGIPRLLRDAQVFSIWEGATNVLALDFLRAAIKENAYEPILKMTNDLRLKDYAHVLKTSPEAAERQSREICFLIGDIFGSMEQ